MHLYKPKVKRKTVEGQMLQGGLFEGFKGSLCELMQHQGKVPRGGDPPTLGFVFVEAIQESVRFSSLLTLMGEFPNLSAMADLPVL